MATFQKGDRVCVIKNCSAIYPPGSIGDVVERRGSELTLRFDGDSHPSSRRWRDDQLAHHMDSFPILGSEDPWRESEPDSPNRDEFDSCWSLGPSAGNGDQWVCTREKGHPPGHHISRDKQGIVNARWRAEPVHNDEVAAVEKARAPSAVFGTDVAGSFKVSDIKKAVESKREAEFLHRFTTKLAIAMFESDHAGTIARVTDGGKEGGISVDEARQRLVWRSGEDQRAQYLKEAEALLKRAVEL